MEVGSTSEDNNYLLEALRECQCHYPLRVDMGIHLVTNVRKTDDKNIFIYHQLIGFSEQLGMTFIKILSNNTKLLVRQVEWDVILFHVTILLTITKLLN